jgi:predicted amidophosphoribosyltransferase
MDLERHEDFPMTEDEAVEVGLLCCKCEKPAKKLTDDGYCDDCSDERNERVESDRFHDYHSA